MIGAYYRVSTEEQKKGETIGTQIFAVSQFIKSTDVVIEKQYKDDGWSGSLLARPALDQLREDIKSGLVDKLIVYHPDRLSRKQSFQFLLLDEFEKAGVKVTFTSLPEYFNGGLEGRIVNKSIFAMISELERVRISERFRLGKLRKATEGQLVTSHPPYGYRYVPEEKRFYVVQDEIEVVKKILDWAKKGDSDRTIILKLKEKGITTRTGNLIWAKSTINKILNVNLEAYAGHWSFNKYRSTLPLKASTKKYSQREKSSRRLNPRAEWVTMEIPKELRILSDADVALIRKRREENRTVARYTKNQYLLRGKIYCDLCNGACSSDSFHGRAYYRCADRRRKFPEKDFCHGGSIKSETIENETWLRLIGFLSDRTLIEQEFQKYIDRHKQDKIAPSELSVVVKEKMDLLKEKQKLAEGYTKGLIDDTNMRLQNTRIDNRLAQLDAREREISENNLKAESLNIGNVRNLIAEFAKDELLTFTFEEKEKALDWLGIKVFIHNKTYRLEGTLSLNSKTLPTTYL